MVDRNNGLVYNKTVNHYNGLLDHYNEMVDRYNEIVHRYNVSKPFLGRTSWPIQIQYVHRFYIYCYYNYTAKHADDKWLICLNLVDQEFYHYWRVNFKKVIMTATFTLKWTKNKMTIYVFFVWFVARQCSILWFLYYLGTETLISNIYYCIIKSKMAVIILIYHDVILNTKNMLKYNVIKSSFECIVS